MTPPTKLWVVWDQEGELLDMVEDQAAAITYTQEGMQVHEYRILRPVGEA